ncbi:hypothetical protein [Streptomyces olivaceus]
MSRAQRGEEPINHSLWKTHRTRGLMGEPTEESSAYVDAGHTFALG